MPTPKSSAPSRGVHGGGFWGGGRGGWGVGGEEEGRGRGNCMLRCETHAPCVHLIDALVLCRDELKALFRVDPQAQCDTHDAIKCG
jgi:hypothetical protein